MRTERAPNAYTVLAIDDDPQSLIVLSKILTAEYEVLLAKNSERGIALACSSRPDLIILDITMPVMDGFQVLSALKNHSATATIPVIFLTSRSSIEDERLGLLLGAADYISKPISPPVVLARVAAQLGFKGKPLHSTHPAAEPSAGTEMRDGFICALALQLAQNPHIHLDALLDTLTILLDNDVIKNDPVEFRSAACLALIGLNQPHVSMSKALVNSRLLIEEILNYADPEDRLLNLAWDISHADALLDSETNGKNMEAMPLSACLFSQALTYHLALLQPGVDLSQRHEDAFRQMLDHQGLMSYLPGEQQALSAAMLAAALNFPGL